MTTIRVAIADDHTLFRSALRELVLSHDGFEVVGEAASGGETVELVAGCAPDVLVLDVQMPGPGAAAVIGRVREGSPHLPIVVLTMHDDAAVMRELFEAGASAFLTKAVLSDGLVAALRSVCRDPDTVLLSVSRHTLRRFSGGAPAPAVQTVLTAREREILRHVGSALSNAQIASRLHVTQATVKRHLTNVYAKLDAVSRVDAIRKATAAGLIEPL
ncbi:response regulator transcription factor [Allorhizocola rhizosphaerae]|uniref:response regulator transcription factor n=1 Tax=Allorhizocola rhizosphaerae TaxID=1872709 RepID=UPI000E3E38AE|nr:response regulator transcription factor [Allorhizocola rhizosphaerae]